MHSNIWLPCIFLGLFAWDFGCTGSDSTKKVEERPALCSAISQEGMAEIRSLTEATSVTTDLELIEKAIGYFWSSSDAVAYQKALTLPVGTYEQIPGGWSPIVTGGSGHSFRFLDGYAIRSDPTANGLEHYSCIAFENCGAPNAPPYEKEWWHLTEYLEIWTKKTGERLAAINAFIKLNSLHGATESWFHTHVYGSLTVDNKNPRGLRITITPFGFIEKPDPESIFNRESILISTNFIHSSKPPEYYLEMKEYANLTSEKGKVTLSYSGTEYSATTTEVANHCPDLIPNLEALFPDLEALYMLDNLPTPTSFDEHSHVDSSVPQQRFSTGVPGTSLYDQ